MKRYPKSIDLTHHLNPTKPGAINIGVPGIPVAEVLVAEPITLNLLLPRSHSFAMYVFLLIMMFNDLMSWCIIWGQGAQWLSGRVLDSNHRRHCVVSLSKNINPSLVLVQPRKTRPFITERLLMGRKETNQRNKQK